MKRMTMALNRMLVVQTLAFVASVFVLPANADYTLTGDETWSAEDVATKMTGVVDLNGHTLTVPQLTGNATITDTSRDGYELLESIESTYRSPALGTSGGPYIKTGVQVSVNTKLELDFGLSANATYQVGEVIFGLDRWGHGVFTLAFEGTGFKFYGCSTTTYTTDRKASLLACEAGKDYHVSIGSGYARMSDSSGHKSKDPANGYTFDIISDVKNRELALFGFNTGIRTSAYIFKRLWITDGAGQAHTFVPVRQLSTGKCGILDLEAFSADPTSGFHGSAATSGEDFTPGAVTNILYAASEATPGELHVVSAEGTTNENTTVALRGNLKLVKEGAGTFVAQKTGQTYFGGTEVAEGLFELYNDSTGYTAAQQLLGCWGSTVTVATGGRLNLSGNKGLDAYSFVLNGGTLGNWHFKGTAYTIAEIGSLKLLADSYLGASQRISVMSGTVDLNEYTLFVETYRSVGFGSEFGAFTLAGSSTMTNGTFNVTTLGGGSFVCQDDNDRDLRTVKLVLSCQTALSSNVKVGDIELKYGGSAAREGKIFIYGTYKAGKYHRYCEMQDGSTLDLSGVTGAWSVKSTSHATYTDIAFASNATVKVSLGSRRLKSEQIVTWEGATAPDASVNFVLDPPLNALLIREPNGLRLKTGLMFRIR